MQTYVHQVLLGVIPQEHHWKLRLFHYWGDIVGSLHDKVRIERVLDDTIVLSVSHPSWAQELLMLSGVLRRKINAVLKEDRIKMIRFSSASFTRVLPPEVEKEPEPLLEFIAQEEARQKFMLTSSEEEQLALVPEKDLRAAMASFYVQCKQRRSRSS